MSNVAAANVIEDVTRKKVFESQYWITKCFYCNAATLVDLAVELKCYGGVYGAMAYPSDFFVPPHKNAHHSARHGDCALVLGS